MADSPAFQSVCTTLESLTSLSALEARGTVRLAIKEAGFDAASVSPREMVSIVERVLPRELELRGIPEAGGVCRGIVSALAHVGESARADSPDAVFRRLGA